MKEMSATITTGIAYSPLRTVNNEIRLLEVLPGKGTSIPIRMRTWPLEECPAFIALSYTWGGLSTDCQVAINHRHVTVRKNLWRFLSQVQQLPRYRESLFWIDALCINQSDNDERTHQVAMMAEIYRSAACVLVWLGPAYGDSDRAMYSLASSIWRSQKDMANIWWKRDGAAIRRLCERGYWTRLWILQELALASKGSLLCGNREISLHDFVTFVQQAKMTPAKCRREQSYEYNAMLKSPATSMMRQITGVPKGRLMEQMVGSAHLGCSDPRDKVYALLGVVQRGHEHIRPDYTIPMPVLLNNVLRNENRFKRPASLMAIKEQCENLCRAVGVASDTMFQLVQRPGATDPPSLSDMTAVPLADPRSGLTLWWASFYRHIAVGALWSQWINEGDELIPRGFNEQEKVRTLARTAVTKGNISVLKPLLNSGFAGINDRDDQGRSILYVAIEANHVSLVRYILTRKHIRINARAIGGKTALHVAARDDRRQFLRWMLALRNSNAKPEEYGYVDINLGDEDDFTPLHYAIAHGNETVVKILLAQDGIDVNTSGRFTRTRQVETSGDKRKTSDEQGDRPPLHVAISYNRTAIVKLLLARRELKLDKLGDVLFFPLHIAVSGKDQSIVQLLLSDGRTNVNCVNQKGHTALHKAAISGNTQMVRLLIAAPNVAVACKTRSGRTPLSIARRNGHTKVAELISQAEDEHGGDL